MIKQLVKSIVKSLMKSNIMNIPVRAFSWGIKFRRRIVCRYDYPERRKIFEKIMDIKQERKMLLEENEGYQIYTAVKGTSKINGDIAEIGTYSGGSSKIICEAKDKNRKAYFFDTFAGLPELTDKDNPKEFYKNQFITSYEGVKEYLKGYKNAYVYKGLFPKENGEILKNNRFSFIHLDVDLYEATFESLKFFYPRMNKGAILISHDYINSQGVKKAFNKFFKDKPECIIEMSGSQALIVKQ